ncbi:hypothetical protein D3C80_1822040 [compost metagenome]
MQGSGVLRNDGLLVRQCLLLLQRILRLLLSRGQGAFAAVDSVTAWIWQARLLGEFMAKVELH